MAINSLTKLKNSYEDVIQAVTDAGGRFLFVGGCVRDALLNVPVKDYDAEVYNLEPEKLEAVLKTLGPVSFAGQSFGVYHLHHRHLEISIPRQDQKIGIGHRGFKISANPYLSFSEASRRRDLTMNSMGYDPVTNELLDPWQGQQDMKDKILRATDPNVFGEDPLRALRVMQLSARFLMTPDQDLLTLCSKQDLSELPNERILTEFKKLLIKGQKPSWGLDFLKETKLLGYVDGLKDIKDSNWQVFLENLDSVVKQPNDDSTKLSFMLTLIAWYIPSKGSVESFLKYLNVSNHIYKEVIQGYAALSQLKGLGDVHAWRQWAYQIHKGYTSFDTIASLIKLVMEGPVIQKFDAAVKNYNLDDAARMLPIVQGKDLINMGMKPGRDFTDILKKCHNYQLRDGCFDIKTILGACLSK